MSDLTWILSTLLEPDNTIKIDGLSKKVAPVTEEERELYKKIDFDLDGYRDDIKVDRLVSEDKVKILMNRWRFPSLSIHGVEGAFSGPGAKTVIPSKVTGKFSIRLVPDMEPEDVDKCVKDYLEKMWAQRGSPNKFK